MGYLDAYYGIIAGNSYRNAYTPSFMTVVPSVSYSPSIFTQGVGSGLVFGTSYTPLYAPSQTNYLLAMLNSLPKVDYSKMWSATKSTLSNGFSTATSYVKRGYQAVSNTASSISVKAQQYLKPIESAKVQNAEFWAKLGYNAEKGLALAKVAAKNCAGRFKGKCATYVKQAIQKAGLGNYIYGVNGRDMAEVYGKNKNFKKISAQGIDVKKLPAGCILCYDAGKSGHHRVYGHTGISLGNGTEVSDGLTRNPKPASYILIPV